MVTINLNHQLHRVEVSSFEIENDLVFNFLNSIPANERNDRFLKAIYIGVLALAEDRISAFFAKTQNELGTELESLKIIFDMKKELFYKSSIKGILAEEEIAEQLNSYFKRKEIKDVAKILGNVSGKLPKNKTGDIVCEVDGNPELRIAIECKFDKSLKMGDISNKDVFTRKMDTAWSQLIEAQANRDSRVSMIVFDRSLVDGSILNSCDNVGYISSIGFVAIIDSNRGDYSNLFIAYMLARDIVLNAKNLNFDAKMLMVIVTRIANDMAEVLKIKSLIEQNIDNNKNILKQIQKSILLIEFSKKYLIKFLADGALSKEDLLNFYMGEEVKNKYSLISGDIESM